MESLGSKGNRLALDGTRIFYALVSRRWPMQEGWIWCSRCHVWATWLEWPNGAVSSFVSLPEFCKLFVKTMLVAINKFGLVLANLRGIVSLGLTPQTACILVGSLQLLGPPEWVAWGLKPRFLQRANGKPFPGLQSTYN